MSDTRERILLASLRLFASRGYEAVSVSTIAGELGMTKGALYKHYKSKRDIFDSIVARMEQLDGERAKSFELPDGVREDMGEAYERVSVSRLVAYSRAQFIYWTEDDFAAPFRRMLTVEQYRSKEMSKLYQQYLADGPLGYVADIFESMGLEDPHAAAASFYGGMFLLFSVYDGAEDKASAAAAADDYFRCAAEGLKRGGAGCI